MLDQEVSLVKLRMLCWGRRTEKSRGKFQAHCFAWLTSGVLLFRSLFRWRWPVDSLVCIHVSAGQLGLSRYYLAITVVSKNESNYLPEWIEYHIIVGVDHFFFMIMIRVMTRWFA
jgi:hypothetical protein